MPSDTAIAHGKVDLSGGATSTGGGYRFPKATGDAKPGSLNASFVGGVRFLGHKEGGSYTLDLTFSHLEAKADGTKGTLVSERAHQGPGERQGLHVQEPGRRHLEAGRGSAGPGQGRGHHQEGARHAHRSGAKAFGGFYAAGDKLDPVTAAVSLDANASLPGAGSGPDDAAGPGAGGSTEGVTVGDAGSVGGSDGTGALASTGSGLPATTLLGSAALLAALGGGAVHAARRRTRTTRDES